MTVKICNIYCYILSYVDIFDSQLLILIIANKDIIDRVIYNLYQCLRRDGVIVMPFYIWHPGDRQEFINDNFVMYLISQNYVFAPFDIYN